MVLALAAQENHRFLWDHEEDKSDTWELRLAKRRRSWGVEEAKRLGEGMCCKSPWNDIHRGMPVTIVVDECWWLVMVDG